MSVDSFATLIITRSLLNVTPLVSSFVGIIIQLNEDQEVVKRKV